MEMVQIQSSNVNKIGYEDGILYVEFKNKSVYKYMNVPIDIYMRMAKADSIGSYIGAYIRPKFKCEKLDADEFWKGIQVKDPTQKEYIRFCIKCGADIPQVKTTWVKAEKTSPEMLKNGVEFKPGKDQKESLQCLCHICGFSWETITREEAVKTGVSIQQ
jgi:hypothetical protein